MRKTFLALTMLAALFALAAAGCKKSEVKNQEKAPAAKAQAEKETPKADEKKAPDENKGPAEGEKSPAPADQEPDVLAGGDDEVKAIGETATVKPEATAAAVTPDEKAETGQPDEKSAPVKSDEKTEGGEEPAVETDVVDEGPAATTDVVIDAAVEELPEGHFGKAFKLDAIMMVADVTKYPDHYSTFESVKLRGKVLAASGNQVLLGHETPDGLFVICTQVPENSGKEFVPGVTIQFEGKLTRQDWTLDAFGKLETGDQEPKSAQGWILAVEGGIIE